MFERTLADLIRGLRASNKQDEATFIARAVDEIRKEVKSKDMELKAAAILKLTYVRLMESIYLCNSVLNVNVLLAVLVASFVPLLARHDGIRHVVGFLQRSRSHVFSKNTPQVNRISSRGAIIQR